MKKVAIIGAGPGGLASAMLLAHQGFEVDIYEKHDEVGGRNAPLTIDGYTFDTGPTFLMMPHVLEGLFKDCERDVSDYLDIRMLDPMYHLNFASGASFMPTTDKARMAEEIERVFPGNSEGFTRFMKKEGEKFDRLYPCLSVPYNNLSDMVAPALLRNLPHLDILKTAYSRLVTYFKHPDMRISMAFQSKYLGMSPWKCPALFTMIPWIEHQWGIHHPIGGLNRLSQAMAQVVKEEGGRIHLSTPVKELIVEKGRAAGVLLENGERVLADHTVINADFANSMTRLVKPEHRRKYTDKKLLKRDYSCSIFMLYLGVKKQYDIPHHNIYFASDYRKNVEDISERLVMSEDPSIYVQNACRTDPTLAPEGKSTLYVLVPVANLKGDTDWSTARQQMRDKTIEILKTRVGLTDLEENIEVEHINSPLDWEAHYSLYQGAVFNLSHKMSQLLYFRPHNRFEEFADCYLVGGGTHPGSGLPTIWESGRIAADLIGQRAPKPMTLDLPRPASAT